MVGSAAGEPASKMRHGIQPAAGLAAAKRTLPAVDGGPLPSSGPPRANHVGGGSGGSRSPLQRVWAPKALFGGNAAAVSAITRSSSSSPKMSIYFIVGMNELGSVGYPRGPTLASPS